MIINITNNNNHNNHKNSAGIFDFASQIESKYPLHADGGLAYDTQRLGAKSRGNIRENTSGSARGKRKTGGNSVQYGSERVHSDGGSVEEREILRAKPEISLIGTSQTATSSFSSTKSSANPLGMLSNLSHFDTLFPMLEFGRLCCCVVVFLVVVVMLE